MTVVLILNQIEATFWHFLLIALSLEIQPWPGICRSHQRISFTLVKPHKMILLIALVAKLEIIS